MTFIVTVVLQFGNARTANTNVGGFVFIFSLAEPAVALTDVGMRVNMEAEGRGRRVRPQVGRFSLWWEN